MTHHKQHWLIRLYPPEWRRQYGDEMDELLRDRCGLKDLLDVVRAALVERYYASKGAGKMQTSPSSIQLLARRPSAFVPLVMSFAALSLLLVAIATGQAKQQSDEGAIAHTWQLLMVGQVPILGWFMLHWLKRDFKTGLPILVVQIAAFAAALLPVWLLGL